ncbi:MmgE/PrpD family protein [Rubritepida flocculans]|uniref:MmgE/PrpD family protein n=1 Tax=Rubritepida flocculans TaxID=182403 RepID=UPI0003FBFE7A|nr:MmgE/PrpD family protein [Rubritepida flocculans]
MTEALPLARGLARFLSGLGSGNIPPEVEEKARCCLLNGYGIALGGHATPYAPVARAAALAMEGEREGGATLWGDGRRVGVAGAALANGALAHGRAQEDSCGAAHLGAVMIPLLTGLFETRRLPMERLLPALVAGYEAGGLFERAYAGRTTPGGFRASPLFGTIAAAAAAARALALDEERTAAALSTAAHLAGGILQSFVDGTDEWRYQVGVAAANGLAAAELARQGAVAAPHAFEGPAGFVPAFARCPADVPALLGRLGAEWATLRVAFKPFPVCAFNQTPVTAALALRERIAGRRIAAVSVRMNPYEVGYAGMDSKGPFSTISGTLMSIPFCIAAALLHGTPTMALMQRYDDAGIAALMERIAVIADESVPTLCASIAVRLEQGEELTQRQMMTPADYAYDRAGVSALVRRIGAEEGVPAAAYDCLEGFVAALPDAAIEDVLAAFALLPRPAAKAAA